MIRVYMIMNDPTRLVSFTRDRFLNPDLPRRIHARNRFGPNGHARLQLIEPLHITGPDPNSCAHVAQHSERMGPDFLNAAFLLPHDQDSPAPHVKEAVLKLFRLPSDKEAAVLRPESLRDYCHRL